MKTVVEYHGEICDSLKELYAKKNADYGDSFAAARKEIPYYTLGRLYDKFNRIKTLTLNDGEHQVADEAVEDTLLDLANYAIMELAERKAEANSDTISFDFNREFSFTATPIGPVKFVGDDGETVTEFYPTKISSSAENLEARSNAEDDQEDEYKLLYDNQIVIADSKHENHALRMIVEHDCGKYIMTIFIDEKNYDDDKFVIRGMKKLRDDFAKYVAKNIGNDTYVVRWDDVINAYNIIGDTLIEVYEKFDFAVTALTGYYAE